MLDVRSATWETIPGDNVLLYVSRGSRAASAAPRLLAESERIVACLTDLAGPRTSSTRTPLEIVLADPSDLLANDLPAELQPGAGAPSRIVCVATPEEPLCAPVEPIVHEMLTQWYGRDATRSPAVVAGLAGYVAACAQSGPPVAKADLWVKSELEAGRFVSALDFDWIRRGGPRREVGSVKWACTSFVAHLIDFAGSAAFRQYFKVLGSAQSDGAAMAAFKQPLAVIEESWLATLRRKTLHGNELRSLLARVAPLLLEYRWRELEVIVLTLLAAGYNMVWPIATQRFIRMLAAHLKIGAHHGRELAGGLAAASGRAFFAHHVSGFLALLLVLYLVDAAVSMRRTYAVSWINVAVLNRLRERMYAHILALSHDFYANAKCADLMARLTDDIQNVQQALQQITTKTLYQIFTLTGGVITLIALNRTRWQMTTAVLLIVPLFAVIYAGLKTRNKTASREQRKRVSQTAIATQESLLAHATIKAFDLRRTALDLYRHRLDSQGRSQLRLAVLGGLSDLSEDMVTALAQIIVFGVGGYLLLTNPAPGPDHGIGDLAAALMLVKVIFGPITSLSGVGQTMQQAAGAMERVSELFEEPVSVADRPDAVALAPISREICFEDVGFGYGTSRSVLRGLDLIIPAGANVAIVGATGSGKTTIINLLLRFWDPESGRILIDGFDLRDITVDSLRSQIGVVFQDTFIFDSTVLENIRIGRPGASNADVIEAATAARLHEDVMDATRFPASYETVLGEGGSRLSGGQRQRVAIARAILRNPRILVLDEATSALDAKTEAALVETLREFTRGRTTISVTHRLSWAATADLIFVIEDGHIKEFGAHAELARAGGFYQRLYEEQMLHSLAGHGDGAQNPSPALTRRRSAKQEGAVPLNISV